MNPVAAESVAASLVARCADDLAARWAAGEFVGVEDALARHPHLATRPDAVLELLAEELALREEYARPTTLAELDARFPGRRPQVRALLECQRLLGGRLAAPDFPSPGETLGDYLLGAELGRGAQSRVFSATQPRLADRPVVLKVSPDTGVEHLSLARLQHANIVPLYAVAEFPDRGLRALCLPDFGGRTLADGDVRLAGATLADAVAGVGAALADALQYAHDRGILHLDVKPSNVLIAADGTPMLLDFHLAHPPLAKGDLPPQWLGGTPGAMAPEHAAALDAVRQGRLLPDAVDGRADTFALGLMLRDFLRATATPVSRGLADIFAKSTAPAATNRYARPADLAADLRCHLADLPLRGVRNRSLAERWRKWRRRRPHALPAALVAAAVALGLAGAAAHTGHWNRLAESGRADGEAHFAAGRHAQAAERFRAAEALADGLPWHRDFRAGLRDLRQSAERAAAVDELHAFAERLRFATASDALLPALAAAIERDCRAVWGRRDDLHRTLAGQPTPARERAWRDDLAEVGGQLARLTHDPTESATAAAAVEALGGWSPPGPGSAWGHIRAGRALLDAGEPRRAAAEFGLACRLDPALIWGHYGRGVALLRADDPAGAAEAFTSSVALAPEAAWCWYNRGLAERKRGRASEAVADLSRAVELDPDFWLAHLELAAAHAQAGRPTASRESLSRAAAAGAPPAEVADRIDLTPGPSPTRRGEQAGRSR